MSISCEFSHVQKWWDSQRLLLSFTRGNQNISFAFLLTYSHLGALCLPVCLSVIFIPMCARRSHIYLDLTLHSVLHLFMIPCPQPFKWNPLLSPECSFCFHFVLFFLCFLSLIQFFLSLSCSRRMDHFISFSVHNLPRVGTHTEFFLCIVTCY